MALRTTRHCATVPLATLLLVLQALAGGAVTLAHASEPFNAPAHIEAQRSSTCIPLHNELRCALCHYAAMQVVPEPARVQPAATPRPEPPSPPTDVARTSDSGHLTAPPRAPPLSAR
jgi:hypothetical protein